MSDKEKLAASSLITVLLFLAPGYLLHVSPRFSGSLAGGVLGIAGASLLVLLLVYPLVKHVKWLNVRVARRIPLGRILSFHIYAGLAGPILGILHSGHKYQSPLGVGLVLAMLAVVLTGFVGRYHLAYLSRDLREQEGILATLRSAYNRLAAALSGGGGPAAATSPALAGTVQIMPLVDAIADTEYAIEAREAGKRILRRWMVVHVVASIVMYFLLGLHIWSGIYYGLRWLP
jgi:hypothetical protein